MKVFITKHRKGNNIFIKNKILKGVNTTTAGKCYVRIPKKIKKRLKHVYSYLLSMHNSYDVMGRVTPTCFYKKQKFHPSHGLKRNNSRFIFIDNIYASSYVSHYIIKPTLKIKKNNQPITCFSINEVLYNKNILNYKKNIKIK